jgi:tetratricopeptide (TPR) repeat protein
MSANPRSKGLPPEPDRVRRAGLWIVALALVVRLVYLCEISGSPTFRLPVVDSLVYCRAAAGLAAGNGFCDSFFFQPFLYPFWLAGVFLATGTSLVAARLIQVLIGCATCFLAYRLGDRLYGRREGVAAGVITALYGPLVFFEAELLATGLAAFWCVALLLLFLKAARKNSIPLFLFLGLCGAAALLTRPTFLPLLLAGGGWLLLKTRRALRQAPGRVVWLAALAGFAIPLLAVASLNSSVTGHFGILPSSGGLNLYIGNNPDSDGTTNARPGSSWSDVIDLPKRHGRGADMWERQSFFYGRVRGYVSEEPLAFATGLGKKTLQFVSSRELPRNLDVYLFREWSMILSLLLWKGGGFGFPFGLLLPLAAAGLFFRRRETPLLLPLFLLLWAAAVVAVFVAARYRVPIVPLLAAPAGAGIICIYRALREGSRGRIAAAAALTTGLILMGTIPGPFAAEKIDYEPELHCCLAEALQQAGRVDDAIAEFGKAIALDEGNADAHVNLATLLIAQNRFDEAIDACETALRLRPDMAQAHCNLAALLIDRGELAEARKHCAKGLAIRPHEGAFLFNLARICAEEGDGDGAIGHLKEFLKGEDGNGAVHFELARLLEKEDRHAEAIEHYRKAAETAPDGETLNGLGLLLFRKGLYEEAAARFRAGLRFRPNDAGLLFNLARALEKLGAGNEAIDILLEARRLKPAFAPAASLLGSLLIEAGRMEEAVRPLADAAALAPDDLETRRKFADALAGSGREKDAIGEYRQLLAEQPGNAAALAGLAWLLATHADPGLRDGEEALHLAERAVKEGGRNGKTLDILAAALAERGRFIEAAAAARNAAALADELGASELARKIRKRLVLYEASRPWRQPGDHRKDGPRSAER